MNPCSPVTVAQHLARVRALVAPISPEWLAVHDAPGHFLAQNVHAEAAIPAFNNSSMDGFVVHDSDLPGSGPWTLPVVGEVPAGAKPQDFAAGGTLRIMTGAPISGDPSRVRVIPTELTDAQVGPSQVPKTVTIHSIPEKRHIRLRGEVVAPGDEIMPASTLVDAGCLAFLLNAGISRVPVYRTPRVAVISSGDELVSAENSPATDATYRIADSNGPMIARLLEEHGPVHVERFHVGDGVAALQDLLDDVTTRAEQPVDLVVTTGGISQGAFDVVKAAVTQSPNADLWFGNAAQRPGSPQGAGHWNRVAMVTLPGNPVAAYVSAMIYVLACLRILQGRVTSPPELHGHASADNDPASWWPHRVLELPRHPELARPRKGKTQLVPVRLEPAPQSGQSPGLQATPTRVGKLGSHFVSSLLGIDALAVISPEENDADPATVSVLALR